MPPPTTASTSGSASGADPGMRALRGFSLHEPFTPSATPVGEATAYRNWKPVCRSPSGTLRCAGAKPICCLHPWRPRRGRPIPAIHREAQGGGGSRRYTGGVIHQGRTRRQPSWHSSRRIPGTRAGGAARKAEHEDTDVLQNRGWQTKSAADRHRVPRSGVRLGRHPVARGPAGVVRDGSGHAVHPRAEFLRAGGVSAAGTRPGRESPGRP